MDGLPERSAPPPPGLEVPTGPSRTCLGLPTASSAKSRALGASGRSTARGELVCDTAMVAEIGTAPPAAAAAAAASATAPNRARLLCGVGGMVAPPAPEATAAVALPPPPACSFAAGLSGFASVCKLVRTGGSGMRNGGSIACCAAAGGCCCSCCGSRPGAMRPLPPLPPLLPRELSSEMRGGELRGSRPSDSGESGTSGRPMRGLPRGLLAAERTLEPDTRGSRRSSCGLLCPSPWPTYDQLARAELGAAGSSEKPPGTCAGGGTAASRSGLIGSAGCAGSVAGRSGELPAGRRAAAASNVLSSCA